MKKQNSMKAFYHKPASPLIRTKRSHAQNALQKSKASKNTPDDNLTNFQSSKHLNQIYTLKRGLTGRYSNIDMINSNLNSFDALMTKQVFSEKVALALREKAECKEQLGKYKKELKRLQRKNTRLLGCVVDMEIMEDKLLSVCNENCQLKKEMGGGCVSSWISEEMEILQKELKSCIY